MSASQTPDDPGPDLGNREGVLEFLQQAFRYQAEEGIHRRFQEIDEHPDDHLYAHEYDDDEDDDDYQDDDDASIEQEEDDEEEDDGGDNSEEDGIDIQDHPVAFFTHREVNIILQGETLHNLFLTLGQEDDERLRSLNHVRRRRQQLRDPNRFPKVPSEQGRKLMDSGIFGTTMRSQSIYPTISDDLATDCLYMRAETGARRRPVPLRLLDRELGSACTQAERGLSRNGIAQSLVPGSNADADLVMEYPAPVYLGQFSDDGNFFYNATKDFRVRMYDTSNINDWKRYKTVVHPAGRWTMTDAALSPDNKWLAFTSMMSQVCLAPTDPNDEGEPYLLDLGAPMPNVPEAERYSQDFAIFSVRFSGDGRELVAGNNDCSIIVYDIESRTVLHNIEGHRYDVNAVCFGDKQSPHLLYSGSDDATIKVWDRRSLGDGRAAGAFVGHCEGITYIDSKGDGRYILSNGKDQTMRLWDLRMAMTMSDFDAKDPLQLTSYSLYDYRFQRYNDELYFKHPNDNSVVTFRGHRVERTLIRCHFSPPGSSDGRYVYSASHSGKVYIWNLDATLAGQIDVRKTTQPMLLAGIEARRRQATEASGQTGNPRGARYNSRRAYQPDPYTQGPLCVRDASWHPTAPVIVASSFGAESMDTGMCSVHSCDLAMDGHDGGRELRVYDQDMRSVVAGVSG
ncbi:hypothetical protein SEPCBS119000_001402 [Sporothrix epigloea]|uniref:WD repeat protein n=1 Tax=Sporothrix epigloea TaxID=1892477 RepID=A0ABP0DAH9_9PEZI